MAARDVAEVVRGGFPLAEWVLLVAVYFRTNLTMRQLARDRVLGDPAAWPAART